MVQGKVDLLFYEGQQIGGGDLVGLRDKKRDDWFNHPLF